jgi:hypothetical protein
MGFAVYIMVYRVLVCSEARISKVAQNDEMTHIMFTSVIHKETFLLFATLALMINFCYGRNLKILCIDIGTCNQRMVTLQAPQARKEFIKACNKYGESLLFVEEDDTNFVTIASNGRDTCFITFYSSEGEFKHQYNIPFFPYWDLNDHAVICGKQLIYVKESTNKKEWMSGKSKAQVYSINLETGNKEEIFSQGIRYYLQRINEEHIIIKENLDTRWIPSFYVLNVKKGNVMPIKFPKGIIPSFIRGVKPNNGIFWISGNGELGKLLNWKDELFEISIDGKMKGISSLLYDGISLDNLCYIIAKTDSPTEYVYSYNKFLFNINHDNPPTNHYLCRKNIETGETSTKLLELGKYNMDIDSWHEYADEQKVGVMLTKERASTFSEKFFMGKIQPEYVIYDRDWNILKSYKLPVKSQGKVLSGNKFYCAYY